MSHGNEHDLVESTAAQGTQSHYKSQPQPAQAITYVCEISYDNLSIKEIMVLENYLYTDIKPHISHIRWRRAVDDWKKKEEKLKG